MDVRYLSNNKVLNNSRLFLKKIKNATAAPVASEVLIPYILTPLQNWTAETRILLFSPNKDPKFIEKETRVKSSFRIRAKPQLARPIAGKSHLLKRYNDDTSITRRRTLDIRRRARARALFI